MMISKFDIMLKNLYAGFIRIHILYHATQQKICGIDIIKELKHHGYILSPGTIYPILHAMHQNNLLTKYKEVIKGKQRIYYTATNKGKKILIETQKKIRELYDEVIERA